MFRHSWYGGSRNISQLEFIPLTENITATKDSSPLADSALCETLKWVFSDENSADAVIISLLDCSDSSFLRKFIMHKFSVLLKLNPNKMEKIIVLTNNKYIIKIGNTMAKINKNPHRLKFTADRGAVPFLLQPRTL